MRKKRLDATGQNQNGEEAQSDTLGKISNVCLFFEADNPEDYQKILSFVPVVRGEIQEVAPVVFYYGKMRELVSGDDPVHLIGKKDFNLFKKRRPALKLWLATHEFDMLISFTEGKRNRIERIIKDIKAKIKIGPNFSERDQYFDISIGKPGEKQEFSVFYKQVKYYFSKLNIK